MSEATEKARERVSFKTDLLNRAELLVEVADLKHLVREMADYIEALEGRLTDYISPRELAEAKRKFEEAVK